MSDELKACPHCGTQLVPVDDQAYECGYPWCGNVNVMPAEFWNRRPVESSLESRLKIAVEALEIIYSEIDEYNEPVCSIARVALKNIGPI